MTSDPVDMKPLFAKLRGIGLPAPLQNTLDLLERDERMPVIWQSLRSKGFTVEDIAPLVRAVLQIKDLADDPPKIARKLGSLEMAAKSSRVVAEFYHQDDPTSTDELKRAEEEHRVLKSRYETFKAAVKTFWPPTTHLDNDGIFSTILSAVLVENFKHPMDDFVATITTVLFALPEPLDANTVGARRRREEKRRASKGK